MNENETNYCSHCDCEICGDDYFTLDDEILCSDCYEEETVECENCRTRIWLDDDAGDSSMHLCQRCYDNYFTTCEDCGRIIDRDLAHYDNGILRNDAELAESENLPQTKIQTDSYVAVQLLERYKELSLESLSAVSEKIDGTFVFTLLDCQNNSCFVRGDNPLNLLHCPKYKFYIYVSTKKILQSALEKLGFKKFKFDEVKTECGDVLKIDNQGKIERTTFDTYLLDRRDYLSYYRWFDNYENEQNSTYIMQLKEFANTVGVAPDDIDLLLEYGYTVDEIEDLIYTPGGLENVLSMIYDEYSYYGEW